MATIVFSSGLDSGGMPAGMSKSGNAPTQGTISASGAGSLRFYLDRTLPVNYRTEAVFGDTGRFAVDQDTYFAFNAYFRNWGVDNVVDIGPMQMHVTPTTWNIGAGSPNPNNLPIGTACSEAVSIFAGAPMFFQTLNGRLYIISRSASRWDAPLVPNRWYAIQVRLRPSRGATGLVKVWVDGTLVVNRTAQNYDTLDSCGNPTLDPYLKIGVYKAPWKNAGSQVTSRELFIDNIIIANNASSEADGLAAIAIPGGIAGGGGGTIDTTAPIISAISETGVGTSTATINFTTDEASTTVINYGLTATYGTTYSNLTLLTAHVAPLTGLTPNTTYNYQIQTTDAAGNTRTQANRTFTTSIDLTTIAPIITDVVATPTDDDCVVTWTTNEAASSRVLFTWNSGASNFSVFDATFLTSHSITASTVSSLPPVTLVDYKVSSVDVDGNRTDFFGTFTTEEQAVPVLRITNVLIALVDNYIQVTWETNKNATSVINLNGLTYKTSGLSLTHTVNAARVKIGTNTLAITSVTAGDAETLTQNETFTVVANISQDAP